MAVPYPPHQDTFPIGSHLPPHPRLRPQRPKRPGTNTSPPSSMDNSVNNRQSGLRNSVLETALELGFGANTTVAKWILNNPLDEDEEEDQKTPELTPASTASESSLPTSPIGQVQPTQLSRPFVPPPINRPPPPAPSRPPPPPPPALAPVSIVPGPISAPPDVPPPRPETPNKLKKLKKPEGEDGYASDATGWLSEGGKRKDKDLKKQKSRKLKDSNDAAMQSRTSLDEGGGGFRSEPETKVKPKKSSLKPPSPQRSRTDSSVSASDPPLKASRSFFRKRKDKEKEKDKVEESSVIEEGVPPLPPMPLPIAKKFAKTDTPPAPPPSATPTPPGIPVISRPIPVDDTSNGTAPLRIRPKVPMMAVEYNLDAPMDMHQPTHMSNKSSGSGSSGHLASPASDSPSSSFVMIPTPGGSTSSPVSMTSPSVFPPPSPVGPLRIRPKSPPQSARPTIATTLRPQQQPPSSANPLRSFIKHIPTPLSLGGGGGGSAPASAPSFNISLPITHHSPHDQETSFTPRRSPPSVPQSALPALGSAPPQSLNSPPPLASRPPPQHARGLVPAPLKLVPPGPVPFVGHGSPLPSPSRILSYYDIPPPSPPPTCPLPQPPPGTGFQRGRESPFPVAINPNMPRDIGFTERAKIPRYRELYGLALPGDPETVVREERKRVWLEQAVKDKEPRDDDYSSEERVEDDKYRESFEEMMESEEDFASVDVPMSVRRYGAVQLQGVLSRFKEGRPSLESDMMDDDKSQYSVADSIYLPEEDERERERSTMYLEDEADKDPRYSTFNASVYSLPGVLGEEKSEETRERFVRRVQALYGKSESEEVPPVPALPQTFMRMNNSAPDGRRF